jgi:hypothetical protein
MKLYTALVITGVMLASTVATARERGPFARSVDQVDAIWLDTNSCMDRMNLELDRRGFFVAGSPGSSDAILEVNVRPLDRDVSSARYTATLRGRNGRPLFSVDGREDGLNHAELCADISETIIRRMEDRMG